MRFQTIVTAGLITTLIGLSYLYTSPKSAQGSAASPELTGVASVIDGDTLEIHGERIRLHGIDAPEADQVCTLNGQQYRCGQKAALALSDFIARQTVFCLRDHERQLCVTHGRPTMVPLIPEGARRTRERNHRGVPAVAALGSTSGRRRGPHHPRLGEETRQLTLQRRRAHAGSWQC